MADKAAKEESDQREAEEDEAEQRDLDDVLDLDNPEVDAGLDKL